MGITLGILIPFIGLIAIYYLANPEISFFKALNNLYEVRTLSLFLRLCLLLNLPIFYIFMKSNRMFTARGIIASTFIYGIFLVYLYLSN